MTQEEKQLLLKDLCARLPYGIKAHFKENTVDIISVEIDDIFNSVLIIEDVYTGRPTWENIEKVKPYLRPMSSMTDEERTKIASMAGHFNDLTKAIEVCFACLPVVDYCYSRHLDIHGLIEKGLALEAKEGYV